MYRFTHSNTYSWEETIAMTERKKSVDNTTALVSIPLHPVLD